jgi:hypothetical protein
VTIDPVLPNRAFPASEHEGYVVEGCFAGPFVEISLSRATRHTHRFGSDSYTAIEQLALKRFGRDEEAEYGEYAGNLEDAARIAARGELGYDVQTTAEDGKVKVKLIARLLAPDGRIHTDISHEESFEDADSELALVRANEKATELRALAEELGEQWTSERRSNLLKLRAEYDEADARLKSAQDLKRIVDAEDT